MSPSPSATASVQPLTSLSATIAATNTVTPSTSPSATPSASPAASPTPSPACFSTTLSYNNRYQIYSTPAAIFFATPALAPTLTQITAAFVYDTGPVVAAGANVSVALMAASGNPLRPTGAVLASAALTTPVAVTASYGAVPATIMTFNAAQIGALAAYALAASTSYALVFYGATSGIALPYWQNSGGAPTTYTFSGPGGFLTAPNGGVASCNSGADPATCGFASATSNWVGQVCVAGFAPSPSPSASRSVSPSRSRSPSSSRR